MPATIQIRVEDAEVKRLMGRMLRSLGDLTPFFSRVGAHMLTSIGRNFREGGRPKWKPLSPTTLRIYRSRYKGARGARRAERPLLDTGRLSRSIVWKAFRDMVRIGTNVPHAEIHQKGGTTPPKRVPGVAVRAQTRRGPGRPHAVRAHTRTQFVPGARIPARPFLVVQLEDWRTMERIAKEMLMREAGR